VPAIAATKPSQVHNSGEAPCASAPLPAEPNLAVDCEQHTSNKPLNWKEVGVAAFNSKAHGTRSPSELAQSTETVAKEMNGVPCYLVLLSSFAATYWLTGDPSHIVSLVLVGSSSPSGERPLAHD
jgi:hypothetical protein